MTSKRPRRTDRELRTARDSVAMARDAVERLAQDGALGDELDPASQLFFEFAAPLLLNARNDEEFQTASSLAEFVWAATHFSAAEQALLLDDFIKQSGVPEHMIPWLLDVYSELAARKAALVG